MAEEEAQMPQDPAAGGDAAAGADAAGGDAAAEQKPAKKGGGIGAFMPLILMPMLCGGMAFGVWNFMMKPQIEALKSGIEAVIGPVASTDGGAEGDAGGEEAAGEEGDEAAGEEGEAAGEEGDGTGTPDDPNELVPIVNTNSPTGKHAVTINPKGTQGRRYLVTEIYLRRTDEGDKGFKARVAKNSKVLEEIVRYELEDRTIEDLQKRYVQEEIKMTLLSKFNSELKAAGHAAPVKRIFFSKWVMQ